MKADLCQIYTDVEGVYTADPRVVGKAKKLAEISFDEMLELATLGAQVLNNRSVELAKKYAVRLEVLSSLNPVPGTIVKEVAAMEGMMIKGVAKDGNVSAISVLSVHDVPGIAFKVFSRLAQRKINVEDVYKRQLLHHGGKCADRRDRAGQHPAAHHPRHRRGHRHDHEQAAASGHHPGHCG